MKQGDLNEQKYKTDKTQSRMCELSYKKADR